MIDFSAFRKTPKGTLLIELADKLIILGRDGWLHSLAPRPPESNWQRIKTENFAAAPASELRHQLQSEFGPEYDIFSTNSFLVVQPRGQDERWPKLFEQSHRSFISYVSKGGVKIRCGIFPMVAVVFPDESGIRNEFDRLHIDVGRVACLYSVTINRVMVHGGTRTGTVMMTVTHEAAHQSAFNSGTHSRINDTPHLDQRGQRPAV